jgi:hypothetical protein
MRTNMVQDTLICLAVVLVKYCLTPPDTVLHGYVQAHLIPAGIELDDESVLDGDNTVRMLRPLCTHIHLHKNLHSKTSLSGLL